MKKVANRLTLLRCIIMLPVVVIISGCILPPPWMREFDPWALTNMTPNERPTEDIGWLEIEVEVSPHVEKIVVHELSYQNKKRSCNEWATVGGELAIGGGKRRSVRSKAEIDLFKNNDGWYEGSHSTPRNKYYPGYCNWQPAGIVIDLRFYLLGRNGSRTEGKWGGGVFSPNLVLSDNCTDNEWHDKGYISYCLKSADSEIVIPNTDSHCSTKWGLYSSGGRDIFLRPRHTDFVTIDGEYVHEKGEAHDIFIAVPLAVKKIKLVYDCSDK